MSKKTWAEVPRRNGAHLQRAQHVTGSVFERIQKAARAKVVPKRARAGAAKKWFEHARRKS